MSPGIAQHLAPELLSALVDDELDPAEVHEVQAHLGSCLHCRQRLDGLRRVAAGLRELERPALPASLEFAVRRQIALERSSGGLRERLDQHTASARGLSAQVGLGFALVLALALIGFLFSTALERQTSSVVVPLTPATLEGSPREAAGRSFVWQGTAWRESGAVGEPARIVARDSPEGLEILLAHPDLAPLFEDAAEIELRWRDELVTVSASAPPAAP